MKQKTCRICKKKFTPIRELQPTCTKIECQAEYATQHLKKSKLNEKKKARRALKQYNDSDRSVMLRKAQKVFNQYIRLRDKDKPCVSCGTLVKEGMAHASHFKPAGNYSYLRFDESNVHKSCSKCNVFLSGNLDSYRIRIVDRIGQDELNRLDKPNVVKKWSIEELREIIKIYKKKIKELQ